MIIINGLRCMPGRFGSVLIIRYQSILASEREDVTDIRRRLLDASLVHVSSQGWTSDAVTLGAKDLQYPEVIQGLFDDPGASLVQHFIRKSNSNLVDHMKLEREHSQNSKTSFRGFVSDAIKYRLQLNQPYMERMAEALSIATRPDQLPSSLELLLKMSDDICYYGGDRSTDMTWYSKRISLATVYAATELYMIQDQSLDHEDTWKFMDRRLDDLKRVQTGKQISSAIRTIGDIAYSFYILGRNAAGMNTTSTRLR